MNGAQLTTLALEASSLLLVLLVAIGFAAEKVRNAEKRAPFAVTPNDAGFLFRSYTAEIGSLRLRQSLTAVFTALALAAAFGAAYLDVSRENGWTALICLLAFSAFAYYAGVFLVLSAMYRIREARIMLHKFVYRNKTASGKSVYVNLMRQSLYYLDKKAFGAKRKRDFSIAPDFTTVFLAIVLTAAQALNVIYLIDVLAPV